MTTTDEARARLASIVADFADEVADLDAIVSSLSPRDFAIDTPARGWTVADQIIHLGLFDRRCRWSISDPGEFVSDREQMIAGVDIHGRERDRAPADLRQWWLEGARDLVAACADADPSAKCPWYGPSMSATSMVTARLMETWAHGQDVCDALGLSRRPGGRLRHIAHIGVRARPFAYAAHKMTMPDVEVDVALTAPDGTSWTWGSGQAANRVSGGAVGFCLAVTQRRHIEDCDLTIEGPAAREWMSIAQAFAGPPGQGRAKGQFTA